MSKMCPAGQVENPTYEEDLLIYYRDKIAPRLQSLKECLEESHQSGEQRYVANGADGVIIINSISQTGSTNRSSLYQISLLVPISDRASFISAVVNEGSAANYSLRNRRSSDPADITSQFVIAIYNSRVFNTDYNSVIAFLRQEGLMNRVELVNDDETGSDTRRMAQSLQAEIDRLTSSESPHFVMQELEVIFNNTEIVWSDNCQSVVDSIQEIVDGAPQECITEDEIADDPVPNPEPEVPPTPVAEDPCIRPDADPWGVRFRYKVGPNANTCLPNQSSREGQATGPTYRTHTTTYEERDWFLTLLPAMKSVFPGQLDTPNAMPGLQFRVFSNIAKHRVPGFQPIYQHLGVESTFITMVGTFTGDGGLGMTREITERNSNTAFEILEGDVVMDDPVNTDISRSRSFTIRTPITNTFIYLESNNNTMTESGITYSDSITLTGKYRIYQGINYFEVMPGLNYISESDIINNTHEGSNIDTDLLSYITASSSNVRDAIEININNYALYKVTTPLVYLHTNPGTDQTTYSLTRGETVLVKEIQGSWALLSSGYWIHMGSIDPITNSPIDQPVARKETVPSTYKHGALFLADACMVDCGKTNTMANGSITLNDWHNQFYNPDPVYTVDSPSALPVWQIAQQLDSYHEFVSFYKLAVQQGNELEVEINTRKYDDGLKPIPGLDDDPLRNRTNGNPKFKGFLRKMEVYAARTDRTWYLMEFEVTDHALAGTQAINLTHDLNAAIDAAMEERNAALEIEAARREEERTIVAKAYRTSSWSTLYLLPEGTTLERKQITPTTARETTRLEFYINDLLVSAHDYNQARIISSSNGKVRFRRNNISLPIEITLQEYQNLNTYTIEVLNPQENTSQVEQTTQSNSSNGSPINRPTRNILGGNS